jgi:hypothetical protein
MKEDSRHCQLFSIAITGFPLSICNAKKTKFLIELGRKKISLEDGETEGYEAGLDEEGLGESSGV